MNIKNISSRSIYIQWESVTNNVYSYNLKLDDNFVCSLHENEYTFEGLVPETGYKISLLHNGYIEEKYIETSKDYNLSLDNIFTLISGVFLQISLIIVLLIAILQSKNIVKIARKSMRI